MAPPPGIGQSAHWKVDAQRARSITKLGLTATSEPHLYRTWHLDTKGLICQGRPGLGKVLKWAEEQEGYIDAAREAEAGHLMGQGSDISDISAGVYDALLLTLDDKVKLSWSKQAGDDRGLELWRVIYREHESAEPEVVLAKLHHFIKPNRCKDKKELKDALREWEIRGHELEAAGEKISPMVKNSAFQDLVPSSMAEEFRTRTDLRTLEARIRYVKTELNYDRGCYVANREAAGPQKGKGAAPMDLSALMQLMQAQSAWPLTPDSEKDKGEGENQGPQTPEEAFGQFLASFVKGKGKGKGGNKGWGKGFSQGQPAEKFEGECFYCHKFGHRANACRKKEADIKAGILKPKGGGKGKGGKGAYMLGEANQQQDSAEHAEEQEQGEQGGSDDSPWSWMLASLQRKAQGKPVETSNPFAALEEEPTEGCDEDSSYDCDPSHECGMCGQEQEPTAPVFPVFPAPPKPPRSLCTPRVPKKAWKPTVSSIREVYPLWRSGDDQEAQPASGQRPAPRPMYALKQKYQGYKKMQLIVDSAAVDSVLTKKDYNTIAGPDAGPPRPGEASLAEVNYITADGGEVPNEGELDVKLITEEEHECGMTWQIADIQKSLLAVRSLTKTGHEVKFRETGGDITNIKTNKKIKFSKKGDLYVLTVWMAPNGKPLFQRPGQ